jgi:spermidine/putrescine ABC transporter ATP-binding subunit
MSGTAGLDLVEVVRDYGKGVRIGPITCSARQGEFVSLLGPSGCGKTTLLRCIAGFEPVDAGEVRINGADVAGLPPHRREVGLVFQNYALFPHLTVEDNVGFGLRLRKIAKAERRARVSEALRIVGLEHLAARRPAQLSGGQQQRVAVARSLVLRPSLMLLDEPLSNLDYKLRIQMRRELHALQRRLGMTFVFVTHDQTEALGLSDRIIVLSQGRIEQQGTPIDIYNRPRTRFVADFIGGSNLLEVSSVEGNAAAGEVEARLRIGASLPALAPSGTVPAGPLWVSIRPESLRLEPAGGPDRDPSRARLTGTVADVVFSGDRAEVTVDVEGLGPESAPVRVVAYAPASEALPPKVALRVEPGAAILLGDA